MANHNACAPQNRWNRDRLEPLNTSWPAAMTLTTATAEQCIAWSRQESTGAAPSEPPEPTRPAMFSSAIIDGAAVSAQVALEVGAVANTPAARRALDAYRALQRRTPQPGAASLHSFEVRPVPESACCVPAGPCLDFVGSCSWVAFCQWRHPFWKSGAMHVERRCVACTPLLCSPMTSI